MQNSHKSAFSLIEIIVMFFLLMFFLFVFLSTAHSEPSSHQLTEKVDDYMLPMVQQHEFSGTILLARDGKVIVSRAYGQANLERGIPNTLETTYRIASLTKSFTAMAILMLQEQGRLKVSDPVCKYVVDCPNNWRDITIHHLLTHTSGIVNYTRLPEAQRYRRIPFTAEQMIGTFKDKPLEFSPGTNWRYSNSGYYLLGVIIEKITGQSYATFLDKNIFKPLGMMNTGYGIPQTRGYIRRGDFLMEGRPGNNSINTAYAAGALYSTVSDLLRWDQALYTERLVKKETLGLMFQTYAADYGYGWRLLSDQYGHKAAAHGGRLPAFNSYIERWFDERVCIIILTNVGNVPMQKIKKDLSVIVFGKEYGKEYEMQFPERVE